MEKQESHELVEVKFVSDQDVKKHIISIKDQKSKSGERRRRKKKQRVSSESEDKSDSESFEDSDTNEKPTELFDDGDVRGQEMFGFQTPRSKNFLPRQVRTPDCGKINGTPKGKLNGTPKGKLNGTPKGKLNGTPKGKLNGTPCGKGNITPQTKFSVTPQSKKKLTSHGKLNGTPLSKKLSGLQQSGKVIGTPRTTIYKVETAKTPYSLRTRLKTQIANTARRDVIGNLSESESESESDFSASESEFKLTDSESSSLSEEEKEDGDDNNVRNIEEKKETKSRPRRERRHQDMEYVLEAEEFFSNQKSVTSNHTLNRLHQPRLAEEELQKLLGNMTLSHQQAVRSLCEEHTHCFDKWMFALLENYNIVLYGLGSKRHTLQQFRETMLQDQLVLEVNGFFPGLTIKEIIDSVADELLELSERPAGLLECLEAIETDLSSDLFLVIHNLEGPMLRSDKSQEILSRLAKMHHVHLIASIDHINAPLIWDHAKLSRYNFLWWDVTSFQPYNGETQFETSLLVQQSGGLALSSLTNVFHSLTTNARSIFIMMVKHQLEHKKDAVYQGMPFKKLYWSAREALLVSSDVALRAQLTEFLDHRLMRQRRSADGSELLQVPVDSSVLQRFLEQVEGES